MTITWESATVGWCAFCLAVLGIVWAVAWYAVNKIRNDE